MNKKSLKPNRYTINTVIIFAVLTAGAIWTLSAL